MRSLAIDRLGINDVPALVEILSLADELDRRYFSPFAYTTEAIAAAMNRMVLDRFYGITLRKEKNTDEIIGFYMLRGLDEGYASPMYGVYVSPSWRCKGVAKLTLQHAITICKINKHPSLLLKVCPENLGAVKVYRSFGFETLRKEPPLEVLRLEF